MASPTTHAKLSPSSADRWIHCPGSVALSELVPSKGGTVYTEEGTAAHAYADLTLRRAVFGKKSISTEEKREYKALKAGQYYSAEMEEAANLYADYVQEIYTAAGGKKSAYLMTEQQLDLTSWIPEGFGQSDAVVIGDGTIHVIDFKYGKGVKVSAEGNAQLRLYALGSVDLFDGLYEFDKVQMVIIQPRINNISTEELTLEELMTWGATVVRPQARKAYSGCDEFAAGDWCRFCPVFEKCRVQFDLAHKAAEMDFNDPMLMTDEDTEWVLQNADRIAGWLKAVQDTALQDALNGKHFDGFKVVEGRSVRKWADALLVAEKLRAAGYEDAMIYERNLIGISAAEKLCGKKKLVEILGDLIIKPEGKPVLVPETDKREAFTPQQRAAEDFMGSDEF